MSINFGMVFDGASVAVANNNPVSAVAAGLVVVSGVGATIDPASSFPSGSNNIRCVSKSLKSYARL